MASLAKISKSREADLYEPLRQWLEDSGYCVRAEVKGCDIAATRGEDLVLIEMKQRISLDLLLQAVRRQQASDSVYVAVPSSREMARPKRWRRLQSLLRRLELGLLVVFLKSTPPRVEVVFHPAPFQRRKRAAERRALLTEMAGRSLDMNCGGTTRRPLVTAYREAALKIACALESTGAQAPRELRKLGTDPKTQGILYDNVYGWFERLGVGRYALSAKGAEALREYSPLCASLRASLTAASRSANGQSGS